MWQVSCLLLLQIGANPVPSTAGDLSYDAAFRRSTVSGRPLVIFVTADWCGACQRMKAGTLTPLQQAGQLQGVEFSVVDLDRQRELASQLAQGGPIPQLIRYDRLDRTWYVRRLVGAQDKANVAKFLKAKLAPSLPAAVTTPAPEPGDRSAASSTQEPATATR
jgi:thiol-disulfide isomerase/thioredoxin